MTELGRIESFPISKQFKKEEDFSKYLSQNLDILSKKLGITLSEIEGETEVPVGKYRCDITGGIAAIENQFGATDHNHLGKLLVYFANQDVKVGVWVCEEVRPEHVKSIQWLNERSENDESFFLLKAKIIRIADSKPAVDFDVIAGPEFKEVGRERRRIKGEESKWTPMLEEIGKKFRELKPEVVLGRARATYLPIPTGFSHIHYEWNICGRKQKNLDVALHFETTDKNINEDWIRKLLPCKGELEERLGEKVHFGSWSHVGGSHRWSKISVSRRVGYEIDDKTKTWAAGTMAKMYEVLTPEIEKRAI